MTDQHDAEPGTSDSGPGRRRLRVDHVGAELAALRRDVGQQGGLLAELAPRVDDLSSDMTEVRALVLRLVEEADEQDREDQAEKEARREVGLLDEPPSPWAWPILDRPTATKAWDALGRWVAAVLCREHELRVRQLPVCWPAHPAAVAELSALRAAHVAAYARAAHPAAALSWSRELPLAVARLAEAIDPDRCPPGLHLVTGDQAPAQRERDRVGAAPCTPAQWFPMLERARAADTASRRDPPAGP